MSILQNKNGNCQRHYLGLAMKKPLQKHPEQREDQQCLNSEIFNVEATAAFLGWSPKKVRSHVARRTIPFLRLGGRIIFRREDLRLYLDQLEGCTVEEALENERNRRGIS